MVDTELVPRSSSELNEEKQNEIQYPQNIGALERRSFHTGRSYVTWVAWWLYVSPTDNLDVLPAPMAENRLHQFQLVYQFHPLLVGRDCPQSFIC